MAEIIKIGIEKCEQALKIKRNEERWRRRKKKMRAKIEWKEK